MFWIDLLTALISIYCAYCGFNLLFSSIQTAYALHYQHQKYVFPLIVGIIVSIVTYCFSIPTILVMACYSSINNVQAALLTAMSLTMSLIFHITGIDKL